MNEQSSLLLSLMRILSRRIKPFDATDLDSNENAVRRRIAGGAAALISNVTEVSRNCRSILIQWLNGTAAAGGSQGLYLIRIIVAVLSSDQGKSPRNAMMSRLTAA